MLSSQKKSKYIKTSILALISGPHIALAYLGRNWLACLYALGALIFFPLNIVFLLAPGEAHLPWLLLTLLFECVGLIHCIKIIKKEAFYPKTGFRNFIDSFLLIFISYLALISLSFLLWIILDIDCQIDPTGCLCGSNKGD
ncbi:MAG: hypothetical protein LCH30_10100 [Proteobacteria bacterium]|nr:hypothetical protein [Pseudomonadota bacterium]